MQTKLPENLENVELTKYEIYSGYVIGSWVT
jgi:hypothetical protein